MSVTFLVVTGEGNMTAKRPRMLLNTLQHIEQPPVTKQLSGPPVRSAKAEKP